MSQQAEPGATGDARRRLSRDERRSQLLAIGRRLVATSSFDALSTDDVAAEAGISRGLLFHYFPSREAFLVAIAEDAADELLALTDVEEALPPLERLRAGLEAYVDYVVEQRAPYLALIRGAAGGSAEMQAVFDATRAALAERILAGLGERSPATPTTALAARGVIAFVEEVVVSWLRNDRPTLSRTALIDLLVAVSAATFAAAGIPADRLTAGR